MQLCDAVKMASLTPARVIGLDGKKGKIEKDFDADLIMFDDDIKDVYKRQLRRHV